MTITAHFCSSNSDSNISFTDIGTYGTPGYKSAWTQYSEYLTAHPSSSTSTTPGGCYDTTLARRYEKTGEHKEDKWEAYEAQNEEDTDGIPGNETHTEWRYVGQITVYDYGWVTKNFYDKICTRPNGQIMNISINMNS